MDAKQRITELIAGALAAAFPDATDLPTPDTIGGMLEIPPDPAMGDFAFPCFRLSKQLRKGPPMIAAALAERIDDPGTASVQVAGGYLNFMLNRENFARDVLAAVRPGYGASDEGAGRVICIDYSSINIAKRFHIGHLSTTMLGHSLKRIYDTLGYKTVGINHLGDWGTQFGKMICAYKRWGDKAEVEAGGVDAMTDLYVRFHEEAEKDPALEDEGRMWFKRIEDGDPEALEIFGWFKEVTLQDAKRVYDKLGVEFDFYTGESFYNDKMDRVIRELEAKNLLTDSEGAKVVDLEAEGMPPCLILKKDGATLYATRDIAAALYRKDTFDFHRALYVVAYQQDLHFRQWFKVVEKMGYEWAHDELVHVSFGMVSFEGQSLSTRKGHTIYLDELLDRAVEKALAIIEEKSPELENKQEVARQVGIGAVIYTDLQNGRIKDIDFWWDRALNFDGETGPYVQYAHARCCSLLRKAGEAGVTPDATAVATLTDDEAQEVLRLLYRFPEVIREAADRYEPSMITRHVTRLAQAYNKYYYEHRILDEDPAASAARVRLTEAVRDVLRQGLWLIGIEAPERM
ncbi:arginine--tRNA ligase [Eubacteriales bacterium OttesenSCG-928-A19]|nr:arginine--tRNA ligase [Eubacteriales bacterium OttesenSCG-928-A19]